MTEFNSNNASTLLARYNIIFLTYYWALPHQLFLKMAINFDRMKMEQKKVQEKAKREHRRVMMAVDEFLKVGRNANQQITVTCGTMFDLERSLLRDTRLLRAT